MVLWPVCGVWHGVCLWIQIHVNSTDLGCVGGVGSHFKWMCVCHLLPVVYRCKEGRTAC